MVAQWNWASALCDAPPRCNGPAVVLRAVAERVRAHAVFPRQVRVERWRTGREVTATANVICSHAFHLRLTPGVTKVILIITEERSADRHAALQLLLLLLLLLLPLLLHGWVHDRRRCVHFPEHNICLTVVVDNLSNLIVVAAAFAICVCGRFELQQRFVQDGESGPGQPLGRVGEREREEEGGKR